jgi:methionyl-tRNA formyltransferase
LINGEEEIGVSAIFGATDFDTGDIIFQSKSKVTYPITIFEAIQSNQKNYLNCAESILNRLLRGETLKGIKQIEGDASYSIWRDENDYGIDWSKSSRDIKRFVDAVGYPYLGALTNINGRRARIFGSDVYPDVYIENRHFGKVLFLREGKPVVICGKGLLMITEGKFEENEENEPLLPLSNFRVRFS